MNMMSFNIPLHKWVKKGTFLTIFLFYGLAAHAQEPGIKASLKRSLNKFVKGVGDELEMPGLAFAVMKNGELVYRSDHGFANLEHEVALTEQSTFPLYSLTKPFIAVGVFQLIEKGVLSLEDLVSKYVSGLPGSWNDVRVKHLLSHSSI